jgi:hypothetical protein
MWGSASQSWFSTITALWNTVSQPFNFSGIYGGGPPYTTPAPAPNSQVGQQVAAGAQRQAGLNSAEGHVTINGEPTCDAFTHVRIVGARPGSDGAYVVDEAGHIWNRQGYITVLSVRLDVGAVGATGHTSGTIEYGKVFFVITRESFGMVVTG